MCRWKLRLLYDIYNLSICTLQILTFQGHLSIPVGVAGSEAKAVPAMLDCSGEALLARMISAAASAKFGMPVMSMWGRLGQPVLGCFPSEAVWKADPFGKLWKGLKLWVGGKGCMSSFRLTLGCGCTVAAYSVSAPAAQHRCLTYRWQHQGF